MSGDDNLWCPSCRAHHAPCAVPPPVADPIDTEREARIRAKLFHARALARDLHRETLHGPTPLATTMALADAVTLLDHELDAERLARQTAERERDEARAMAPRWVREGRASTLRVGKVALARVESYRDNAGFVYRVTAGGTLVATGIIHQADAFRAACVAVGIPEVPRG